MNIEINVHVSDKDFITAVFEGGLNQVDTPWWVSFRGNGDTLESSTEFVVEYCDPDNDLDQVESKTLTLDDLGQALKTLLSTPSYHCGEIITHDVEDWDMCVADLILQHAVFGEEIYG